MKGRRKFVDDENTDFASANVVCLFVCLVQNIESRESVRFLVFRGSFESRVV